MMRNFFQTLVLLLSLLALACNNPSATDNATATKDTAGYDAGNVEAFIKKEGSAFQDDLKRGDSNAIAAHYASDGLVMPPNSESVKGNDIVNFWGGAIRMGVKELKLNITDITGDGNVAAETGTYEMFGADNKSLDKGKYLVVWKKDNGNWKIYRDIFNTSMPAAPAK